MEIFLYVHKHLENIKMNHAFNNEKIILLALLFKKKQ